MFFCIFCQYSSHAVFTAVRSDLEDGAESLGQCQPGDPRTLRLTASKKVWKSRFPAWMVKLLMVSSFEALMGVAKKCLTYVIRDLNHRYVNLYGAFKPPFRTPLAQHKQDECCGFIGARMNWPAFTWQQGWKRNSQQWDHPTRELLSSCVMFCSFGFVFVSGCVSSCSILGCVGLAVKQRVDWF